MIESLAIGIGIVIGSAFAGALAFWILLALGLLLSSLIERILPG